MTVLHRKWLRLVYPGLVLVLLTGLAGWPGAAAAPVAWAVPNAPLTGAVLIADAGPAAGARVVALQGAAHPSTLVDANGAYTLTLLPGTWAVNVVAPPPGLASPTWVYTAGAQVVTVSVPPAPQSLTLTVTAANAVVTGLVVGPAGETTFGAPNRVWVRAENQEGQGNIVQVDPASGAFSVNVLPGDTLLRLVLENPEWAPPTTLAGSSWYANGGNTQSVGTLALLEKGDTITGVVLNELGQPVPEAIPVRAWRLDGSEAQQTLSSATDGTYALHVVSGTWELRAAPMLTSTYVTAQSPQTVILPSDSVTRTQILRIATGDVTVTGTLVDSNGMPLPTINRGRAYAVYSRGGVWTQLGPSVPITTGQFTLKLAASVATNYRLHVYLPDGVGYTAVADVPISVSAGATPTVTLPVAPNNSTISGHFSRHDTGQPQVGLPGIVFGTSDSGAWDFDRLNPVTGVYSMTVVATDVSGHGGSYWLLHAFVDPVTGYVVQRPRLQSVFIPYNNGAGGNVTADFTVALLDAAITGKVTDPQGQPVPGARVSVHEVTTSTISGFDQWAVTGLAGNYTLRVPAGTYRVRAEHGAKVAPVPQTVSVSSGLTVTVDLQFRQRNAVLAGTVTYNGAPHTAFIRAYSSTGARALAVTGPNGGYLLDVNAGDVWHIQAVSEEATLSGTVTVTTFLKSTPLVVTPAKGSNANLDLALQASGTLPDALAFSFAADEDQAFTLSDGAQVIIPAGALALSGTVSLLVKPVAELADSGGAQPVSFGYRLLALDASGLPITHFNAPVTLRTPFTAAQLVALGVTPSQLVPSYWDEPTSSWKPVPVVTVEVDSSGNGTVNFAVEHFTDYAVVAQSEFNVVYLPMAVR